MPLSISFDSNSWEKIFETQSNCYSIIQRSLNHNLIRGFICDAAFRIEAVQKSLRPDYFSKPHITTLLDPPPLQPGFVWLFSLGPNDADHPGIPEAQWTKVRTATSMGVQVMRGLAWLDLPSPLRLQDLNAFVTESVEERAIRETKQIDVAQAISARGVGKAQFDAAGGWTELAKAAGNTKRIARACAEWADGELAAAHIAYGNDILCSDDEGRSAGASIFNPQNRKWLSESHNVQFLTLSELLDRIEDLH